MSPVKVAIAGATGNLGPSVLKELVDAGFNVTVLTRADSSTPKTFDSNVKVAKVDYTSLESLTSALQGNEVVVNTLGNVPRDIQLRLVDAAAVANVNRFIPSEFGCDTTHPNAAKLPVFATKVAIQDHLKQLAAENKITYTLVATGPFLDWGLKVGFVVNLNGPVTDLYDGGKNKFSATTLESIGKSVVGVIKNLEVTKNRVVRVRNVDVTQNEILQLSGKIVDIKNVDTRQVEQEAYAELKKEQPNPAIFARGFLKRAIFGGEFGTSFETVDNELLGVKTWTDADLKDLIANL